MPDVDLTQVKFFQYFL